jgi:hypothetical protein
MRSFISNDKINDLYTANEFEKLDNVITAFAEYIYADYLDMYNGDIWLLSFKEFDFLLTESELYAAFDCQLLPQIVKMCYEKYCFIYQSINHNFK